jgi:hypothetical protein
MTSFILPLRVLCAALHETFVRRLYFEFSQLWPEPRSAETEGCGFSHSLPMTAHAQLALGGLNLSQRAKSGSI